MRKIIGWLSAVLLVIGQALPWTYSGTVPATQCWDFVFSHTSRPNFEWWIWLLAPGAGLTIAVQGLIRHGAVPKFVFITSLVFFSVWIVLMLGGGVKYLGVDRYGFMTTLAGLVLLVTSAFLPGSRSKDAI